MIDLAVQKARSFLPSPSPLRQFHRPEMSSSSLQEQLGTEEEYRSSSDPTALQQLYRLDRSSSGFHYQLSGVLYSEDYKKCVHNLQGDDLVQLVDYLDKVRHCIVLLRSPLTPV